MAVSNAIVYRMAAGIPGDPNRAWACVIEPQIITPVGSTGAPGAYGLPVNIDATTGLVRTVASPDAAAYGMLVRPFPANSGQDGLGTSTPVAKGPCEVMVSGYITVLLNGATAAKKAGIVYIRILNASAGKPIGGIEAASDGGNTIALPINWYFMGPADANGNVEIAVNA